MIRAEGGLRWAAIFLAGALLDYAGRVGAELGPWMLVALPAGLAIAATCRWGWAGACVTAAGAFSGAITMGTYPAAAAAAAALIAASPMVARPLLRRLGFDARLERASDVITFTWVIPLTAALPVAAITVTWFSGSAAAVSSGTLGRLLPPTWLASSLGMLSVAVVVLSLHRGVLHALQPGPRWSVTAIGVVAVTAMVLLFWLAPVSGPGVAAAALFLPPFAVGLLALRGQLALAASGLLATALLASAQSGSGLLLWQAGQGPALLGAWLGSCLATMLTCHAASVHWRDRALRWEWALDGSRLGVADWHLQRSDSFVSAAWRSLTDSNPRRWSVSYWLEQVHPDDRDALSAAVAALTAGQDGRRRLDLRVLGPSGWRWLETTLLVIERHRDGAPLRLLATLADAQQRHEALERQLMSVSLFQHLHEGLLVTDGDLRALDVNPAYTHITGVPREQLLGTVPSLLRPDPADPVARQQRAAMWAGLRDQGSWRGELHERRPSGEFCTVQATISTVRSPTEDLRYHVLVISDITQQQQQREQLERQAHFDELTRLPNRSRLSQLMQDAMLAADKDGHLLVVCYLDLDHFKPVNDRLGHAAGDGLLAELADRLRTTLRSRMGWEDIAARLGGDEFVLLLHVSNVPEARLAVDRVLRVVSQPYAIGPDQEAVPITASMGATMYPLDRSDADALLRHADNAMYDAKQFGRNGYRFFDSEERRRTEERAMQWGRVEGALDRREFVLHYQPQVDMRSGQVEGFEALLRWEDPERGLVLPLRFLPQIEKTPLSAEVGRWVLAQALDHLAHWRSHGLDVAVSVNVSARHLQEPNFALHLSQLLARHREPLASRLRIEMLETAVLSDVEATSALVTRCQAMGVRFALDDFGTGYSPLTYLKQLPVDILKIDRSFVSHMLDDAQDRAIVEGVIGLARTFNCTVVAEGVETPAQARTLLELGCEIGQGTGIAAPMPADQVVDWVREYRGIFALAPAALTGPAPDATPGDDQALQGA